MAHARSLERDRDFHMTDEIISLFPTTLMKRRLAGMADHNIALASMVRGLELNQRNASSGTSTKGGFQTREDLLSGEHPEAHNASLLALKRHIGDAVQEYAGILIRQECAHDPESVKFTLWGWGVILRQGNWQGQHVHAGANISGVYYIATPPATLEEGRDEGKISFFDPRPPRQHGPASHAEDAPCRSAGAGRHDDLPELAGAFGCAVHGRGRAHLHRLQCPPGHGVVTRRNCV
jgi:uncharacterized protein (TIGR02466 family)